MTLSAIAKSIVPQQARPAMKRSLRKIKAFGTAHYCVLCESRVRHFLPDGQPLRPRSLCPVCKSKGRHRIFWHYLTTQTSFLQPTPLTFLHFAPEPAIVVRV